MKCLPAAPPVVVVVALAAAVVLLLSAAMQSFLYIYIYIYIICRFDVDGCFGGRERERVLADVYNT